MRYVVCFYQQKGVGLNLRHIGRRILGLDRPDRNAAKGRRGKTGNPSGAAKATTTASDEVNPFLISTADDPLPAAQPTATPDRPLDFEISKARPALGALAGRLVLWAVLIVVLLAGLVNIGRNVFSTSTAQAVTTETGIDREQAAALAGRFTADYLSHDPTHPTDEPSAAQLVEAGDTQTLAWGGTGWMSADVVIPGEVVLIDDRRAIASVQARVLLAAAPAHTDTTAASAAPSTAPSGLNGDVSIPPDGFRLMGALWLSLQVPLVSVDGHLAVAPSGPVFAVSPPGNTPPAALTDVDAGTTSATRDWAITLFTSFTGQSSAAAMTYLTDPGHDIATLNGAVALQRVQSWSMTSQQPSGTRFGTAAVVWNLAPGVTDLTIQQRYRVTATSHDQRWFASAIEPAPAQ